MAPLLAQAARSVTLFVLCRVLLAGVVRGLYADDARWRAGLKDGFEDWWALVLVRRLATRSRRRGGGG